MKKFIYLATALILMVSCNTDDDITEDLKNHYRAKTDASIAMQNVVFEYTPAPGQFINETKTAGFTGEETTPESAIAYATKRMEDGKYVSLGGFGGYIIVGFDHSIENMDGYDFLVRGNSFKGSSEPAVVWVMQDENGNGQPDDTWYELAGSETGKPETIQNYAVTYYRPEAEHKPVKWTDSAGNEGQIDYLGMYHSQTYYYPAWIKEDSYTLTGTFLAPRNYDKSGNGSYWVQDEYEWGYADNFSPIDFYDKANNGFNGSNMFDISKAIDNNGVSIDLKYIDFIKVQTACNTKSGALGENSTEVLGFFDYSMMQE